ncbi:hypothetical protein G4Y79_24090 [Phototrophicus methaneseepsis]|uniref:Uncharacterized protein n=1 Tax=Phototrophicus methaneseepsis TaxID=2710758 RepID=A0A7S8E9B9_9CHLR|nr:hypothetical protein [Phototrophicus methaneseepsis]QPC82727.1 hypothetical protein G4Y79_24090 [Phototrophicus methaneseepsis]
MANKDTKWLLGIILMAVLVILQIAYQYAQTPAGDGTLPLEYPRMPPATAWAEIQQLEATTNAIDNRNLGITATPGAMPDSFQDAYDARATNAAATP